MTVSSTATHHPHARPRARRRHCRPRAPLNRAAVPGLRWGSVLCEQAGIMLKGEVDTGAPMASIPRTVCRAQLDKLAELGLSFFSAVPPPCHRPLPPCCRVCAYAAAE